MTDVNLSTLHFNYHREGYYNTPISCQIAHEYPSLANAAAAYDALGGRSLA